MSLVDGQRVSFIGADDRLAMGDTGRVLAVSGQAAHVLWITGAAQGDVTLTDDYDLAPLGRTHATVVDDGLDDSLDVGSLASVGALAAYDEDGEAGVLNALAASGDLDFFTEVAQEALVLIQSRLRQEPVMRVTCAQLGDEAAEALISLASTVLLRDAFGVVPEE